MPVFAPLNVRRFSTALTVSNIDEDEREYGEPHAICDLAKSPCISQVAAGDTFFSIVAGVICVPNNADLGVGMITAYVLICCNADSG